MSIKEWLKIAFFIGMMIVITAGFKYYFIYM